MFFWPYIWHVPLCSRDWGLCCPHEDACEDAGFYTHHTLPMREAEKAALVSLPSLLFYTCMFLFLVCFFLLISLNKMFFLSCIAASPDEFLPWPLSNGFLLLLKTAGICFLSWVNGGWKETSQVSMGSPGIPVTPYKWLTFLAGFFLTLFMPHQGRIFYMPLRISWNSPYWAGL